MQISKMGFELSFSRKSRKKLSLEDIATVNDMLAEHIKTIGLDVLKSRVSSVCVSSLGDHEKVRAILRESGIIVVPGFLSPAVIEDVKSAIIDMKKRIEDFMVGGESYVEDNDIIFQRGASKLSGYSQLSGQEKAVVQVRSGQDQGMVDVFNIDYYYLSLKDTIRAAYEESEIGGVIADEVEGVSFKNLNFYFNDGVKKTRGFHADSYSPQLKAFIYLTDCLSLEDGPYTYVKGSHVDSSYRRINQLISSELPNKTEAPLVDVNKIVPVLAKKGSLVISDQSGFHRGFPQEDGHSRVISVMNIK